MCTRRRNRWLALAPTLLALSLLLSLAGSATFVSAGPVGWEWPPTWPPPDRVFPLVKTGSADVIAVGDEITYSINVRNLAPAEGGPPPEAWNFISFAIEDVLPEGMAYVSSEPAGIYDAGQRRVRWELGLIPRGSERTVTITLRADPAVILETCVVTNFAEFWVSWWGDKRQIGETRTPDSRQLLVTAYAATTVTVETPPPPPPYRDYTRLLQQGKDGYDGNMDTYLDRDNPNTNYGSSAWMYLKTIDSATVLSRWDLAGLPAGAQITSAKLRFHIGATNPVNAPISLQLYSLLRGWNDGRANWNYATSVRWSAPGANGAGDRTTTPDAEILCYRPRVAATTGVGADSSAVFDPYFEFDITTLAQQWVTNPDSNIGVIIKASICQGTATYRLFSANSRTQERRPELYLEYTAPYTP